VSFIFEKTNKITARSLGKVAVEVQARDFTLRVDEPKESGGGDTGMSPVEMLLCSMGACEVVATSLFARQMRIELEELWVEVEGDLDSAGQLGYTGIRPGYQNIRLAFHIKTDAPPAKVQSLIDLVEQRCPVADSLRAGVPLGKPKVYLEY
jgi:Predicted redox protein, regulator of disulfide bond formation